MKRKIRNEKVRKHIARRARVKTSIASSRYPRLTVFRSSKHIYAQLDDPESGRTIATVSTRSKAITAGSGSTRGVDGAKSVGKALAERAREEQIERVVFNRNGFLYHGRVKALAEAAREAGLKF
jgi:large subunit ribosomal protein L18